MTVPPGQTLRTINSSNNINYFIHVGKSRPLHGTEWYLLLFAQPIPSSSSEQATGQHFPRGLWGDLAVLPDIWYTLALLMFGSMFKCVVHRVLKFNFAISLRGCVTKSRIEGCSIRKTRVKVLLVLGTYILFRHITK